MPIEMLISLASLAFAAAFTPGPNNTLVATSGARFGFNKTLPMIFGIGFGFPFMIFCVALGLGALFEASIFLREVMRWAGVLILIWFAWKIANGPVSVSQDEGFQPLTFLQMAGFQWINPKGWAMAISVTAQFAGDGNAIVRAIILSAVFVVMGLGSATTWTFFGKSIRQFLTSEFRFRIFNIVMAALILMSVLAISFADLSSG